MITGPSNPEITQEGSPFARRMKTASIGKILAFLRAHPVLCLLLLSPGIPEYLSGSSAISAIIINPAQFLFQLSANLGLYGPGVLLIREAKIRWHKGWGSVLLMGAAYGILEEGIALSTLYNPQAPPVGKLGYFGHYLGVNWVWLSGILSVHMIFSISLPILLLGLALPEIKNKEFLDSRRKITATFVLLGLDVLALFLIVLEGEHFWMGWSVFLGSVGAIAILLIISYYVPAGSLGPGRERAKIGPKIAGLAGAAFYSSILFVEFGGIAAGVPAFFVFCGVVLTQCLFLLFILMGIGRAGNERSLIALSIGLIVPILLFGNISQITSPVIYFVDFTLILFFRKLWLKYSQIEPASFQVGGNMTQNPQSEAQLT
ncbi:MAG TPA: hypothetical protein VJN71_05385 [Nitrososphaerales archaeon]|nr:hypothetical protein [Nitrososphaerales archaeon]